MIPSELQSEVVLALFRGEADPTVAPGTDSRAWRADGLRAARLAQATLERLPVSAAWLLGEPEGWDTALGFSVSSAFGDVVRKKRRLLEAAAEHFQSRVPGALIALEHALALAADHVSDRDEAGAPDEVGLGAGVSVVEVPGGLAQSYGAAFEAVCVHERADRWTSIVAAASTHVVRGMLRFDGSSMRQLVVPDAKLGATVEVVEGPLATLLWFLRASRPYPVVVAHLTESEGLATTEAEELLADLAGDGILSLPLGRVDTR